jgi:hypothetical protein
MVMMVAVLTVGVLFIKGLPFDLWHNDNNSSTIQSGLAKESQGISDDE